MVLQIRNDRCYWNFCFSTIFKGKFSFNSYGNRI